jgi:hypothetical protein
VDDEPRTQVLRSRLRSRDQGEASRPGADSATTREGTRRVLERRGSAPNGDRQAHRDFEHTVAAPLPHARQLADFVKGPLAFRHPSAEPWARALCCGRHARAGRPAGQSSLGVRDGPIRSPAGPSSVAGAGRRMDSSGRPGKRHHLSTPARGAPGRPWQVTAGSGGPDLEPPSSAFFSRSSGGCQLPAVPSTRCRYTVLSNKVPSQGRRGPIRPAPRGSFATRPCNARARSRRGSRSARWRLSPRSPLT